MGKFRTSHIGSWVPVVNEETYRFPAGAPLRVTLRAYGPACLALVNPEGELLVLGAVENGETFIEVPDLGAKEVQVFTRTGSIAAFRAEATGHSQVKGDEQSFTVLKPRIVMSDEMRMMQQMLRNQRAHFERELNERDKVDAARMAAEPKPVPGPTAGFEPAEPSADPATQVAADPAAGGGAGA